MATVSRTWVFTADLEGLADVGDSAIPVAFDAGKIEFGNLAVGADLSERARGPVTAGNDWTVLFPGLPAGATVTNVQCTAYQYQRFAADKAWRIRMRIVDSAGVSVVAADLVDFSGATGNDGAPVSGGGLAAAQAVNAGKQAAATLVALELQFSFTGTLAGNEDVDFDTIAVTVTYTTAAAGVATRAFQEADAFQPTGYQKPDPSDAFITPLHAFFQEGAFQRPDPTGVFQFQGFDDEGFQSDFEAFYATMFQPRAFQIDEPLSPAYIVSGVGAIGTAEAFGGADRVVRWLGPGGVTPLEQFGVAHVTRWLGPAAVASAEAFGQSSQLRRILAAVGVAPSEAFGTAKIVRWVGPSGVGSLEQFGTAKAIRLLGPAGVASVQAFGTAKLIRLIFPLGVASAEAFGRPMEIGGILGAYQITGVGAIASLEQFGAADKVIRWVGPGGVVSAQAFGVTKTLRWIGPGGVSSAAAVGGPGLLRRLAAQGIVAAEFVSQPKLVRRLTVVNITTGEAFGVTTVGPYVVSAAGVPGTVAVADQATIRAALADQQTNVAALADGRTVSVVTGDGQTWLVSVADTVEINVRISNRPGG